MPPIPGNEESGNGGGNVQDQNLNDGGGGDGGAPPAPDPNAGGGGGGDFDWSTALSDKSLLGAKVLNGVATPDDLVKRAIDLEARAEVSGLKLPDEHSTPEEIQAFREAVGVPKEATPEAYGFKDPGFDANSGVQFSPELSDWAAKKFHEAGIPKAQGEKLFQEWNALQVENAAKESQELNALTESTQAALKQQYGQALPGMMKELHMMVATVGGEHAKAVNEMLADPRAGSDPNVMGFMFNMLNLYKDAKGEDAFKGRDGSPLKSGITPSEAKAKIAALTADPKGPYWNKEDPRHQTVLMEVNKCYEALNPQPGDE